MSYAALLIIFNTTSAEFKLPPKLLESLCFIESSHNVNAIHKADGTSDSVGVCQVKLKTARFMGFRGTEKQLMKPSTNIYYAAKYLSYQIKRYKNTTRGIVAYNRGNAKLLTSSDYSDKVITRWRGSTNVRRYAIN